VAVVSAGHLPVLWVDNAAVVSAPAEIDAANAGDVLEGLLTAIRDGPAALIVDLTATTFCDSAAVHALVKAFKEAGASGVELRLAAGGPAVGRLLEITGVDQLIGTYPTVPESLIGKPPPPEAQPTSKAGG
jgi:anti-sigma B factor antagonist